MIHTFRIPLFLFFLQSLPNFLSITWLLDIFRQLQLKPLTLFSSNKFNILLSIETIIFLFDKTKEVSMTVGVVQVSLPTIEEPVKIFVVVTREANQDYVE